MAFSPLCSFYLHWVPRIQSRRVSNPGVLVSHAITNFKKALETLHKHTDKEYHKAAIVQADEFKVSMSGQQPNIQQRLSR